MFDKLVVPGVDPEMLYLRCQLCFNAGVGNAKQLHAALGLVTAST